MPTRIYVYDMTDIIYCTLAQISPMDTNWRHVGDKEEPNIQSMQCWVCHHKNGMTHGWVLNRAERTTVPRPNPVWPR